MGNIGTVTREADVLHKSCEAMDLKADDGAGTFQATVAVFNNIDSVGDRIMPGAFDKTLAKWRAMGDPVPVILSHQSESAMSHVGYAMPQDIQQTSKGLLVKGHLDIADNEVARQVHKLMKRRSLKEFSFGYKVPRGGEKRASDGANELHEIDLIEVGPTLKGANPATELHGVKSALAGEPRDEATLRKAADKLLREDQAKQLVKADAETEEDEQDTLEVVLELLGDFLETEDDPDDIAAAKDIVTRVQALLNSEDAETPDSDPEDQEPKSESELRRQSRRLERERQAKQLVTSPIDVEAQLKDAEDAMLAREAFNPSEVAGIQDGLLKAAWTASYENDLPDSAFLYVESGAKDADGKTTPRSLRHFPYRDAKGKADVPHLRNTLARIPESSFSKSVKDRLSAQAQRILASSKSEPVAPDKEPTRARSADPLRKRSLEAVLEIQSDGLSRRKSPAIPESVAVEAASEDVLKRQSRDLMLSILMETE